LKNLPEAFLQRLGNIVPTNRLQAVMRSFEKEKPTTFRVNTLRGGVRDVLESLKQGGFKLGNVSWMKEAFILQNKRQRDLEESDEYAQGRIYLQNLSSMVPPLVLDPKPGEQVLDLAAAPGSKTTQMAARMEGRGKILAVDENEIRLERLKANLARQGADGVECFLANGAVVGNDRPEAFDRVLLDAPCSSEGRFLLKESRTFSYWTVERVRKTARLQKRLVLSALRALKVGGTMVYSTCTFSPEENEGVLSWALKRFEGLVEIEEVGLAFPNAIPGLTTWQGGSMGGGLARARRILPTDTMEGFFVARLVKKASLPREEEPVRKETALEEDEFLPT